MKGIGLSFFFFILFMIMLAVVNRIVPQRQTKRLFFPVALCLMFIPVYVGGYVLTPETLFCLPKNMAGHSRMDLCAGALVFILLCIGLNDFLIAAVIQPFSALFLVMIYDAGDLGIRVVDLENADKDTIRRRNILDRRSQHLLNSGYAVRHSHRIQLTSKGRLLARVISLLQRWG